MPIVFAAMVPHPPLIIPQVGRGQEQQVSKTIESFKKISQELVKAEPDTIVITTPHTTVYSDYFHISPGKSASGGFESFGVTGVNIEVDYDTEMVSLLEKTAKESGFYAGTMGETNPSLDHGTTVPLYYIEKAYGGRIPAKVVRVGLSGLTLTEHYKLGQMIKDTAEKLGRKVAFVASGDLSHKLKDDGPYGFVKEGPEYDKRIMDVMGKGDFGQLFDFPESLLENAAECGHRSFVIMAGSLDGMGVDPVELSYEGTFGVGYGICYYLPTKPDESRYFLKNSLIKASEKLKDIADKESPQVKLARKSLETYIKSGAVISPPKDLPNEMTDTKAGAFVTIKIDGQLRGCIGTISPTTDSLAEEIIRNAVQSGSRDPRFPPVSKGELAQLVYSVDVLAPPEDIDTIDQLDIDRYGVIVSRGHKRGLLLPMLEGVSSVEEQVSIAKSKAGIGENQSVQLQRFEVTRYF